MNKQITQHLNLNNYYEILKVNSKSTSSEIKQSYRSLALKFHPDKNTAKGAKELFAKISTAYAILSHPQKRNTYNSQLRYKEQQKNFQGFYHAQNHQSQHSYQNRFNSFAQKFKEAQAKQKQYQQNKQNKKKPQQDNPYYQFRKKANQKPTSQISWLMVIFIFLFFYLLSSFGSHSFKSKNSSSTRYQMSYSNQYSIALSTQILQIKYFVKKQFSKHNLLLKQSIDNQINLKYITKITEQCNQAIKLRAAFQKYAINNKIGQRRDYYNQKAKLVDLNVCDLVKKINIQYPNYIRSMFK